MIWPRQKHRGQKQRAIPIRNKRNNRGWLTRPGQGKTRKEKKEKSRRKKRRLGCAPQLYRSHDILPISGSVKWLVCSTRASCSTTPDPDRPKSGKTLAGWTGPMRDNSEREGPGNNGRPRPATAKTRASVGRFCPMCITDPKISRYVPTTSPPHPFLSVRARLVATHNAIGALL